MEANSLLGKELAVRGVNALPGAWQTNPQVYLFSYFFRKKVLWF